MVSIPWISDAEDDDVVTGARRGVDSYGVASGSGVIERDAGC